MRTPRARAGSVRARPGRLNALVEPRHSFQRLLRRALAEQRVAHLRRDTPRMIEVAVEARRQLYAARTQVACRFVSLERRSDVARGGQAVGEDDGILDGHA